MNFSFCVFFFISLFGYYVEALLDVLLYPASVHLVKPGAEIISTRELINNFLYVLGMEQERNEAAHQIIEFNNPFAKPEAAVIISVDGVSSLNFEHSKSYPTTIAEEELSNLFKAITDKLDRVKSLGANKVMAIMFWNEKRLTDALGRSTCRKPGPLPLDELSCTKEDLLFLAELDELKSFTASVPALAQPDGAVDVFHVRLASLHALALLRGRGSRRTAAATALLRQQIEKLTEAFRVAYGGRVLVAAAVGADGAARRRARRATPSPATPARVAHAHASAPHPTAPSHATPPRAALDVPAAPAAPDSHIPVDPFAFRDIRYQIPRLSVRHYRKTYVEIEPDNYTYAISTMAFLFTLGLLVLVVYFFKTMSPRLPAAVPRIQRLRRPGQN